MDKKYILLANSSSPPLLDLIFVIQYLFLFELIKFSNVCFAEGSKAH